VVAEAVAVTAAAAARGTRATLCVSMAAGGVRGAREQRQQQQQQRQCPRGGKAAGAVGRSKSHRTLAWNGAEAWRVLFLSHGLTVRIVCQPACCRLLWSPWSPACDCRCSWSGTTRQAGGVRHHPTRRPHAAVAARCTSSHHPPGAQTCAHAADCARLAPSQEARLCVAFQQRAHSSQHALCAHTPSTPLQRPPRCPIAHDNGASAAASST
jgi:hypothetical protein